jgi:hypothetical protein
MYTAPSTNVYYVVLREELATHLVDDVYRRV